MYDSHVAFNLTRIRCLQLQTHTSLQLQASYISSVTLRLKGSFIRTKGAYMRTTCLTRIDAYLAVEQVRDTESKVRDTESKVRDREQSARQRAKCEAQSACLSVTLRLKGSYIRAKVRGRERMCAYEPERPCTHTLH